MRFAWQLTGRSEEMRIIEAALSAPDLSGIVVCGAAGVGKSRIAREALTSAASRGYETRWAIGTSSARALPLGAFATWTGADVTDTLQLVRGVIESLTSAPRGTTVVVGVDDAHLLDDLSTFVLHQSSSAAPRKFCSLSAMVNRFPPGCRRSGRGTSLTGSTCSHCRATKPRRWSRPLSADPSTRMPHAGCGR